MQKDRFAYCSEHSGTWQNGIAFNHIIKQLREFAKNTIPVLRRIFVRIQGATIGVYCNIRALSKRGIRTKRQARLRGLFLQLRSYALNKRPPPPPANGGNGHRIEDMPIP